MAKNVGQKRAASRKARGYWQKQTSRTARNVMKRLERHCAKHPKWLANDPGAIERRRNRLKK